MTIKTNGIVMDDNEIAYLNSLKKGGDGSAAWAREQLSDYYNMVDNKFDTFNSQHDGINNLKRFEFAFMGQQYKFLLNPEEYHQAEPARITVTQTKGGAYVDDFGAGIITISFKGTTGVQKGTRLDNNQRKYLDNLNKGYDQFGKPVTAGTKEWARLQLLYSLSGFQKFKELRDLIRANYSKAAPGKAIPKDKELVFHNYTDGEHWVVVPQNFELMRSISRPLVYLYDVTLICIRAANQPKRDHADVGGFGKISYLDKIVEGEY